MEEEIIVIEDDEEEEIVTIEEGEVLVYPDLQEKVVTPTGEVQEVIADEGVYGLSKVTVNRVNLQDKTVTPTSYQQIITADSEYSGLDSVTVVGDNNLVPQNIAEGKTIFNVTGTAKVEEEETFDLNTIDPYGIEQILVDDNYNNGQYTSAIILLMTDTFDSIALKGAVAYKTSDEKFYTSTYNTEVTHTWDRTKDTVNAEGVKTRWVIFYNPNTGLYNANQYYDVIATIWDNNSDLTRYGSSYLYQKIRNVRYIKFINRSGTVNFSGAFRNLNLLEQIDGTESLIINSVGLESLCSSNYSLLKIPEFAGIDISAKVLSSAFSNCYKVKEIPNWIYNSIKDLTSIQNIGSLFYSTSISKIEDLDLSNFSSSNDVYYLFGQNQKLKSVGNLMLGTGSVSYAFQDCIMLETIEYLDISNMNKVNYFFSGCTSLKKINLSETKTITSFTGFFSGCRSLESINNLDFDLCTSASSMFSNCSSLMEIENITNINVALSFSDCNLLSHDTLIRILNALVDLTGQTSKTLTLGTINKSKLTDEELQIAINKNWSVS